jgi:hypothetical protein
LILAWVISLLLLCTSLVIHLERLTVLRMIEIKTIEMAQKNFITTEKAVFDCEKNLATISLLTESPCFIQAVSKSIWLITSKEKPTIQIHVALDEKSGVTTRLNWRQVFE